MLAAPLAAEKGRAAIASQHVPDVFRALAAA
jgi:hypothetical protein